MLCTPDTALGGKNERKSLAVIFLSHPCSTQNMWDMKSEGWYHWNLVPVTLTNF